MINFVAGLWVGLLAGVALTLLVIGIIVKWLDDDYNYNKHDKLVQKTIRH